MPSHIRTYFSSYFYLLSTAAFHMYGEEKTPHNVLKCIHKHKTFYERESQTHEVSSMREKKVKEKKNFGYCTELYILHS